MVYADTDLFVAVVKDDDWLQERALSHIDEHEGEIWTSLATFIELFWICEEYDLDREQAAAHILELASVDFDENVVFRADEYVSEGLTVLDAFHLAIANGDPVISSEKRFDRVIENRVTLEPGDE